MLHDKTVRNDTKMVNLNQRKIELKTDEEINLMVNLGGLLRDIFNKVCQSVKVGLVTIEIDKMMERMIRENGGEPTFLGYNGFPYSICASVNEEVVHGFPSEGKLKSGDILSIDAGLTKNGFCVDKAVTVIIGEVNDRVKRLVEVTRNALYIGLNQARIGNRMGDLSNAIQSYVEKNGFSVVREYVGHGIGRQMHEGPEVPNFGIKGVGKRFEKGLVLAIEPMVNIGGWETRVLDNGWTVVTEDGSCSAHFEHTVAITENGPLIIT